MSQKLGKIGFSEGEKRLNKFVILLLALAVSFNVALRVPIATKEQVSSQHSLAHSSYIYSGAGYPRGDSQSQKGTVEHITVRQAIRDVTGSQGLVNT